MSTVRVVSHVHSDWSYDGSWSLSELAEGFGQRGYDAVLLAEHDRGFDPHRWSDYRQACASASSPLTLLVPGIEYSDPTNTVHVPTWGDIPFLGEGLQTDAVLSAARAAGAFTVLAHPARRDALRQLKPELLEDVCGVELWNRKYDGYAPNRDVATLVARHPRLIPFVSLDFHTARQFHPLAMVLDVEGAVTEASLCAALHAQRARPTAFGLAAERFARHPAWPAIRGIERSRRHAARHVKAVRRRWPGAHA